jgi:hypothetical protein
MPQARLDLINKAFEKLDKRHAGFVTIDDLRDRYSVEYHPKYKSGEMTADQVLTEFLDSFQAGSDVDDKVTETARATCISDFRIVMGRGLLPLCRTVIILNHAAAVMNLRVKTLTGSKYECICASTLDLLAISDCNFDLM